MSRRRCCCCAACSGKFPNLQITLGGLPATYFIPIQFGPFSPGVTIDCPACTAFNAAFLLPPTAVNIPFDSTDLSCIWANQSISRSPCPLNPVNTVTIPVTLALSANITAKTVAAGVTVTLLRVHLAFLWASPNGIDSANAEVSYSRQFDRIIACDEINENLTNPQFAISGDFALSPCGLNNLSCHVQTIAA